jgi:hypothetical protein
LRQELAYWIREAEKDPSRVKGLEDIETLYYHRRVCTHSTSEPNQMTLDELDALQRFREHKCKSAPWLLDIAESPVQPGTHENEIVGGYMIWILMTKLPGERITYSTFCGKSLSERQEIRDAFRDALT